MTWIEDSEARKVELLSRRDLFSNGSGERLLKDLDCVREMRRNCGMERLRKLIKRKRTSMLHNDRSGIQLEGKQLDEG